MDALKNFANINLNSNTTNKFTGSIHNQLQAARYTISLQYLHDQSLMIFYNLEKSLAQ